MVTFFSVGTNCSVSNRYTKKNITYSPVKLTFFFHVSVQFDLWPECLLNFLFTSFHSLTYGPTPRGSGSLPQSFSSASAPSTSLYRTGSRTTCPSNTWTSPPSSPSSSPSTSSPSWTPSPCAAAPKSPGTGGSSPSRSVLLGARHHTGITLKENCLFLTILFERLAWF